MASSTRGSSLVGTLCFISLLGVLAFSISGYSISHMTISRRSINEKVASDLAESAANLALSQILRDAHWQGSLEVPREGDPHSQGRVTFEAAQAKTWSMPASYNNLTGQHTLTAHQRLLGPESLQIIAYGHHSGVTKQCEILVHIPAFRYALVSNGAIHSSGGMTVAGIEDPSLLANGLSQVRPEQLQQGYLAANSLEEQAVVLESSASQPSHITGGVESAGGIQLGQYTEVAGIIKEKAPPVRVIQMDISEYDPKLRSDVEHIQQPQQGHLEIEKVSRRQGNLEVNQGLTIKKGYLYIDGDLQVKGGLHGTGCIFATGSVRIEGVSTFSADAKEAIIAQGDIELAGSDQDQSIFQGIVYTSQNFVARNVTVVGAVLAGQAVFTQPYPLPAQGNHQVQVRLERANLIHCPQILSLEWDSGFSDTPTVVGCGDVRFRADLTQSGELTIRSGNKPRDFFDASQNKYTMTPSDHRLEAKYKIEVPEFAAVYRGRHYTFASLEETLAALSNPQRQESIRSLSILTPPSFSYETVMVTQPNGSQATEWREVIKGGLESIEDPSDPRFLSEAKLRISAVQNIIWNDYLPELIAAYQEEYERGRRWMNMEHWGMSFDPNQFLQTSEKTRKLFVRDTLVLDSL